MRLLVIALLTAAAASPQDASWHRSLKDGKKAAASSGKPILLVTLWDKGT